MKKKTLFLLVSLSLICLLALCVSADEVQVANYTYYLVQSYDSDAARALNAQGITNIASIDELTSPNGNNMGSIFSQVKDAEHIEFILAENIYTKKEAENRGILVNRAITVTIKYNGFIHVADDSYSGTGIFIAHHSAAVYLVGTKGLDENGVLSKEFVKPTLSNGYITDAGNLDAFHYNRYAHVRDGKLYLDNMRIYGVNAGISSVEGVNYTGHDVFELVNCALGSDTSAASLQGGGRARKEIRIENCYFNTLVYTYTVVNGSYIKNSTLDGGLIMDCWDVTGQLFELESCVINGSIKTYTGRTHFQFTDCEFDILKVSLGSDGGGGCQLHVITTASCTRDGSKFTYKCGDMRGVEDTSFYVPAYGHEIDPEKNYDINYESLLCEGKVKCCKNCGISMVEEELITKPLFEFLGYSTPEDGSYGIVASFIVNIEAVKQYEDKMGKSLSYGIVAGAKANLGDNNPLCENGNATVLEKGNVLKVGVSRDYASYDFILTGLNENQLDTELVIATYVEIADENGMEIVYLQGTQKTSSLDVISYNTIQ